MKILANVLTPIPCVKVDEFLLGDFQKYVNNNVSMFLKDLEITQKAETYEKLYVRKI